MNAARTYVVVVYLGACRTSVCLSALVGVRHVVCTINRCQIEELEDIDTLQQQN